MPPVRPAPSFGRFMAGFAMFLGEFVDFAGLTDMPGKKPESREFKKLRRRLRRSRCKRVWRHRSQPGWRGIKRDRSRGRL